MRAGFGSVCSSLDMSSTKVVLRLQDVTTTVYARPYSVHPASVCLVPRPSVVRAAPRFDAG